MATNMLNREQPKRKNQNALFTQGESQENDNPIAVEEQKEKPVEGDKEAEEKELDIKETPEPESPTSEQQLDIEIVETEGNTVATTNGDQVQVQSVTIIKNTNQIQRFKVRRIEKQISVLEMDYIKRLQEIRQKIDNPDPIDRINKRRKYTIDKRRNVTFSIREDLSYLMDDLVDDAKIFKGLFQDEIMLLGIQEYIKKFGLKK